MIVKCNDIFGDKERLQILHAQNDNLQSEIEVTDKTSRSKLKVKRLCFNEIFGLQLLFQNTSQKIVKFAVKITLTFKRSLQWKRNA